MPFRDELAAAVAEIRAAAHERLVADSGGAVGREVERAYETDVSALSARWMSYGEGDATLVQALVDAVAGTLMPESVHGHIEIARSDVARVSVAVERWHGTAAAAFRRSFVGSYDAAVANQLVAVRDLARILTAYLTVMTAAQRTLLDLGRATTLALRDSPGVFGYAVPGSVAGPLAGATLFDAVAAADPEPPGEVTGDSVDEILASMDRAVTRLGDHVDAEEDVIRTALDTAQARLDANLPHFLPADSEVGDDLNEFGTPGRQLVTEVAELYHAGNVDLTNAADHYEQAWRSLDLGAVTEPAAFGPWFGRTLVDYRTLRQTFSSQVLLATRDELVRHGDDLCAAALLYAEADGIDAHRILQIDVPNNLG